MAALHFTEYNSDHLNYCTDKKDALELDGKLYEYAQKVQVNKLCGETLCNRIIYQSELNFLSERTLSKELEKYGDGGWYIIWAFYSSLYVTEKIETYLFDFDTTLVAIGGSLGLFLGWSCYSMVMEVFEFVYHAFNKRNKKLKLSPSAQIPASPKSIKVQSWDHDKYSVRKFSNNSGQI